MFDDLSHFARFMGVSTRTAARWRATPTSVPAAAMRLLNVLELLERESPALLTLLIGQARKVVAVKPEVARFVPSGPYGNWVERPAPPEVSRFFVEQVQEIVTPTQRENQAAWDAGEYDHLFTAPPYTEMSDDDFDLAYVAFKLNLGIK